MQRFTEIKAWKRSHELVLDIYRLTADFPADERYGITSQLRRAAASVPSNIAEGSKRAHAREYARFLNIAEASAAELEYFVILSRDLGLLGEQRAQPVLARIDEVSRMVYGLRLRVEEDARAPR